MNAGCHQASDVRHIYKEKSANAFGGLGDARKIDDAGIGAGSRDDHFGFVLRGQPIDFVVIDLFVVLAHTIRHEFVHATGKIKRMAVREVAAVRKIHAQHGVARLQRAHVNRNIGLRAGVRLHVGMFGAKDLLGAIDCELLDLVGEFASAVVALAGIPFGVLVRRDRADRFQHGGATVIITARSAASLRRGAGRRSEDRRRGAGAAFWRWLRSFWSSRCVVLEKSCGEHDTATAG